MNVPILELLMLVGTSISETGFLIDATSGYVLMARVLELYPVA